MSDTFANFDPLQVTAVFNGLALVGFAESQYIECERAEDAATLKVGAQGDATRSINRNKSGTVKIVLMAASPSNGDLSKLAKLDAKNGKGFGELQVHNLNGDTVIHAQNAWVKKLPPVKFDKEPTNVEWVFHCAALDFDIEGAIS